MDDFNIVLSDRIAAWAWEEIGDTAPGATSYGKAIRVKYPIKAKKLEKSIQKLIDNFDAYRMVFKESEGKLYAKVLDHLDFKLLVIDPPGKTKEEKMKFVREDCQRRIDSKYKIGEFCGCAQFVLYKLGLMDNVIFIAMTHLITDGNSLALTFYNVISYYMRNKPMYAAEGSFVEYIEDETAYLASESCAKHKLHWDEVMEGYVPAKIKPSGLMEYDKEKSGTYFDIYKENIPQMAEKYNSSVFNVLLTAFHLALYAANGTGDNLVKYADANRNKKYKYTLGFLALFVPSRIKIDKNMRISELISNVTKQSQKDYAYKRSGSFYSNTGNIFSYLTNNKNSSEEESFLNNTASSAKLELLDFKNGRDNSMLIIVINDMPDKFIIELTGSSRIYGQDYVENFKNEYIRIVELINQGEDMSVAELLGLEDEVEEI